MSAAAEAKMLAIALAPDLGARVASMAVVEDNVIETAATDCRKIYVNPQFWGKLNLRERAFVLLHEAAHCALGHLQRMRDLGDIVYNVAADVIVNELVENLTHIRPLRGSATRQLLAVPGYLMTTEEVYRYLLGLSIPTVFMLDDLHPLHEPVCGAGRVGSPFFREYEEGEAGTPWTRVLRRYMLEELKNQYQSWTRYNRRFGFEAPGYVRDFRNSKVFVAIDTSLSIDEEVLGRFIAEARSIAALTGSKGYVVFWSEGVDGIQPLRRGIRFEPKSTGGTTFLPAARKIAEMSRGSRAVCVVLTDGFWFDEPKATEFMRGARAVSWVIATTKRRIEGFPNVEVR